MSRPCDYCGVSARLPSLRVCGNCYTIRTEALQQEMTDPESGPPKCSRCFREEHDSMESAHLCLVPAENAWVCAECLDL